ncbi:hypothetical protein AAGW05_08035 [Arthrobacter sp. LAPM80]|uniref:PspA/IM30 family protein n=1 Tax=Arthrobacter sp. LAPM80 TaxID=3141788 RepID=UPI00398B8462
MSIFARIAQVFSSRDSAVKHDAGASSRDQPTLADAQLKQQAAVQKMRRGVADVSVSRQRLDVQAADLQRAMDALEVQAQKSRRDGDESAAQNAMGRQEIMGGQLADLISRRDALAEQETMLIAALTQLQARVSGFNVTVETLKATRTAADADHAIAMALKDFEQNHPTPDTGP